MTERLCTNQQEQQQERYKVYDDSNRLLSPSGALGSTDVAATATWPNTKCNLSKGSQREDGVKDAGEHDIPSHEVLK